MDEELIDCMTEAGLDTVEILLRRRMEDALSRGNIGEADEIESRIKSLDHIDVCKEEDHTRGFSMMMRDRARNL